MGIIQGGLACDYANRSLQLAEWLRGIILYNFKYITGTGCSKGS